MQNAECKMQNEYYPEQSIQGRPMAALFLFCHSAHPMRSQTEGETWQATEISLFPRIRLFRRPDLVGEKSTLPPGERLGGAAKTPASDRPKRGVTHYSQSQSRTSSYINQSRSRSSTMSQAPSSRKRWVAPGMKTSFAPSLIRLKAWMSSMRI